MNDRAPYSGPTQQRKWVGLDESHILWRDVATGAAIGAALTAAYLNCRPVTVEVTVPPSPRPYGGLPYQTAYPRTGLPGYNSKPAYSTPWHRRRPSALDWAVLAAGFGFLLVTLATLGLAYAGDLAAVLTGGAR